jgi:hypothetical protein
MEAASKTSVCKGGSVQGKAKAIKCLFLGVLALGLLAQPEFARPKTVRSGKQQFTATRATSVAVKPVPQQEVGKIILVLQTRDNLVTVRSTGGEELRYSVTTLQGIALADGLSTVDLKNRFPELHDVVTGIAWAGM